MYTQEQKEKITEALSRWVNRYSSARQAAVVLGVSSATVSNILNGKTDKISEEMWRRVEAEVLSVRGGASAEWVIAPTTAFQEFTYAMDDARANAAMTWIVADAGAGKTTTARVYADGHKGCYYVLCAEDMKRGDFLRALAQSCGVKVDGLTMYEMPRAIVERLKTSAEDVLLIFDEADKLQDSVFAYFITLYNMLEGSAGIVCLSTEYIVRRIENGLRLNRRGYHETHSRLGRRFFRVSAAGANDIYAVCTQNGLTDEAAIKRVIADAAEFDNDMRRVRRAVRKQLKIA